MPVQNAIDGINRLTVSETSKTPPPPGFNNIQPQQDVDRSGTPSSRCQSTSYNNLKLAFGSGLADSMDDSTGGGQQLSSQSQQQDLRRPSGSGNNGQVGNSNMSPGRINTPDTYTRQSRHSVTRLMGSGSVQGASGK